MAWFMGIDVGSGTSKGVITKDGKLLAYHLLPSGANYGITAQKLRKELLAKAGLLQEDISYAIATGYGAGSASFCEQEVADLRCCARGINAIFPSVRTVIDIGEQSSQVIRLNEEGGVNNFVVSEKCSAGSGRFLNIIANILRIDLKDIGPLSLMSKNPIAFTTGCAVFWESEAITRVAEGISKEDILAGVHRSLAEKISALIDRIGLEKQCAITGGGGLDVGLIKSVERKLKIQLLVPTQPQIITALGASIMAEEELPIR
jgi:predicted CoA-substrate-specific enzyme activase